MNAVGAVLSRPSLDGDSVPFMQVCVRPCCAFGGRALLVGIDFFPLDCRD